LITIIGIDKDPPQLHAIEIKVFDEYRFLILMTIHINSFNLICLPFTVGSNSKGYRSIWALEGGTTTLRLQGLHFQRHKSTWNSTRWDAKSRGNWAICLFVCRSMRNIEREKNLLEIENYNP